MRHMTSKMILISATLMLGASGVGASQKCPDDPNVVWSDCLGTYEWDNGDKYVGEWKSDKKHGKGTFTFGKQSEWFGDEYTGTVQRRPQEWIWYVYFF